MINPVNPNNPGTNLNPNSALPLNNGTNPAKVNNAAFEASILQAQGQGGTQNLEKIVQAEAAGHGAGVHAGGHHHHGGGNEGYLNGIASLGLTNPPGTNTTTTDATITTDTNNDETLLDTLV
jgi:hypothetical protein